MHQILPELFPFWWKLSAYCIVETNLCRTLKLNIYFLYENKHTSLFFVCFFFCFFFIYPLITKLFPFTTSFCPSLYCGRDISEPFEIWSWPWPYVEMLINFWADCIIYYQLCPFLWQLDLVNKVSYILDMDLFKTLKLYMLFLSKNKQIHIFVNFRLIH